MQKKPVTKIPSSERIFVPHRRGTTSFVVSERKGRSLPLAPNCNGSSFGGSRMPTVRFFRPIFLKVFFWILGRWELLFFKKNQGLSHFKVFLFPGHGPLGRELLRFQAYAAKSLTQAASYRFSRLSPPARFL